MEPADLVRALRAEARFADERRLLVVAAERERCYELAREAFDAVPVGRSTLVGRRDVLPCERVAPEHADRLLGTTRAAVAVDCHDTCRPNALGRVTGAVDGGGLLVVLAPPLEAWPDRRDEFDASMAAPPHDASDVTGRFRRRLVATLRAHLGVAILGPDGVEDDGLTDPPPRRPRPPVEMPEGAAFPAAVYRACRTADQADAVAALEALRRGAAVVVEADRGRGKSSAAGLAAAALALEGRSVLVTAPSFRSAAEVFARGRELLAGREDASPGERELRVGDGRVWYADPGEAVDLPDDPDAVVVDEAAALPVERLAAFLDAPAVAYATTVHGYEGSGRGFDVRFREHLADADREVVDATMTDPVRYAPGDPVESWAFHALLLDARPAVDPLVEGTDPDDATYRRLDADELAGDENLLREAFGLLVAAHYRTEPADLARLLDAPNLATRALCRDGHVVSVALLAREGGLSERWRARLYGGARVRGHMLPDVFASQLRDEAAAEPEGLRVVRVATHAAARSRGLGSRLLAEVRDEFGDDVDWLGVGFGATPELLRFWNRNGFDAVHLSTTRNEASGEYSALLLSPTSDRGRRLRDRQTSWFTERAPAVLADALDDADPDLVRAALGAAGVAPALDLSERGWRLVAGAAFGPGMYGVDPRPFRRLAVRHLVDREADLGARAERLLVRKVLQCRPWDEVADELGFHSTGQCMRALGETYRPLVERYGGEAARAERDRY